MEKGVGMEMCYAAVLFEKVSEIDNEIAPLLVTFVLA